MMEIWKDVVGYEGLYEVSSFGRVRSLDRTIIKSNGVVQPRKGKLISQNLNLDGYCQLKLCRDGNMKTVRVHRLVADAFIPNPENLTDVNHKDCNRQNNNVLNLEWLSFNDNIKHSVNKGHYSKSKYGRKNGRCVKIKLMDSNKNLIKEFDYIKECCEYIKEIEKLDTKIASIHDSIKKYTTRERKKPYLDKYYFEKIA